MHDQNSIDQSETPSQKYQRALDLFTESVLKPDHNLRGCAHNQGCYDQLMEIREHVLEYLKTLKEVTHHTNADESDEIETAKLIEAKDKVAMESNHLQSGGKKIVVKVKKSSLKFRNY